MANNKAPYMLSEHTLATDRGTPRVLHDRCNNGDHRKCQSLQCECECHAKIPLPPKTAPEIQPTFMDAYGTIDIAQEPLK